MWRVERYAGYVECDLLKRQIVAKKMIFTIGVFVSQQKILIGSA